MSHKTRLHWGLGAVFVIIICFLPHTIHAAVHEHCNWMQYENYVVSSSVTWETKGTFPFRQLSTELTSLRSGSNSTNIRSLYVDDEMVILPNQALVLSKTSANSDISKVVQINLTGMVSKIRYFGGV